MPRRKIVLRDAHLKIIRDMAARGCRESDIARACGVSQDSFMRLKQRDERVLNALEEGRAVEHDALRGNLYDLAMDSDVPPRDRILASMFLLKCRHSYVEGASVDARQTNNVTINLPGARSESEYMRTIEHGTPALDHGDPEDDD